MSAESFLSKFTFSDDKDSDLLELAKAAEAAERYEDMCIFMNELVQNTASSGRHLAVEERNLLSVAYKNVIGARRSSWRTLAATIEEETNNKAQLNSYKEQVEKELQSCSTQVLTLLTDILVKNCGDDEKDSAEAKVFYLKMSGDYHRYLAEAITNGSKSYGEKADADYKAAVQVAKVHLAPTHPVRLGLALNYSVCLYEILKQTKQACDLAKSAFDEAISKLDSLQEADYKDSTLIMQLLRDNLTLWTSSETEEDGITVEDLSDGDN